MEGRRIQHYICLRGKAYLIRWFGHDVSMMKTSTWNAVRNKCYDSVLHESVMVLVCRKCSGSGLQESVLVVVCM
jgi:hypothetical protein